MRTFFRSKWVIFGAVLILLIILIFLAKMAFAPVNNLPTKNITSTPKTIDLCAPFPIIKGEINCEEAKTIALTKLPGLVLEINKKSTNLLDPNGSNNTHKLWFVTIRSKDLIKDQEKFIIGINTNDGKINYFGMK